MPIIHSPITKPSAVTVEDTGAQSEHLPTALDRTRSVTNSSRSSPSTQARKANATAAHMRRQLEREQKLAERERERERKLAELQKQVEDQELQAELASIDAASYRGSIKSVVSETRTNQWVSENTQNRWVSDENDARDLSAVEYYRMQITLPSRPVTHTPPPATVGCEPLQNISPSRQVIYGPPAAYGTAPPSNTINGNVAHQFVAAPPPIVTTCDNPNRSTLWQAVADTAAAAKALATNQNKIAKPDLFPFFGNTLQGLQFKHVYESTKMSFSPLDNLIRLQNALRGPARDAVAPLLIAGEDPDVIIRVLEENFARPEYIVYREVETLKGLPKLGNELKELPIICNRVRNSLNTIKLLNRREYLFSPELFHAVLAKLNPFIKLRWTDFAMGDASRRPKLEILADFLKCELDKHVQYGLSQNDLIYQAFPSASFAKHKQNENIHVADVHAKNKQTSKDMGSECLYCKKGHNIKFCSDFKVLSIDDRWNWLKSSKICYRCLKAKRHSWKACRVPAYGENGCLFHHHPLLHGNRNLEQHGSGTSNTYTTEITEPICSTSFSLEQTPPSENKIEYFNTFHQLHSGTTNGNKNSQTLLKIVPVTVTGPTGSRDIFALLDDGSTATLIESSVAAAIGATGPSRTITVNGIGGLNTEKTISYVDFRIKGRYTHESFLIKNVRSMTGLSLRAQTVSRDIASYSHLTDLVDTLTYQDATPSMLIGTEHWYLSISHETRLGKLNQPVACRTVLGWTLYGFTSSKTKLVEFINHTTLTHSLSSHNQDLDLLIKEHYKLESIGISKQETIHSRQDLRAIEILNSTTNRLPSGRFEVGMPWRDDIGHIPDSFPQALSRFINLEKRMRRDLYFTRAYTNFIDNMLGKEYAEECPVNSYHNEYFNNKALDTIRFYLPHFGVFHPQKRKLRVVLDAAAKTEGINLNSLLLPGPDLLQCMLGILFRFREGRVAMSADIKEMFSQIRVRKEDRDALRFLWRPVGSSESTNELPIKEYRMSSVIFGASCSPFIAQHVKNFNAKQLESHYSKATEAILNDHYMDDYIGSVDTTSEASQLAADIVKVHQAACMEMRGWASNYQDALKFVPIELRQAVSGDCKVLGIKWSPDLDFLGFRSAGDVLPAVLTKRTVLSSLMRVYDPLGLLAPVVVKGRILFQQIWRSGIDWDTQLSSPDKQKWENWFQEVTEAASIKIPRWYAYAEDCEPFEREIAFACVAFWRLIYNNGNIRIVLICSKARVAPIKPVSIPRLELQAALIASRLAVTIRDSHRKNVTRTYFWTDSMIVLGWLRSDTRTFQPFVAHRLGEILENSSLKDWHWVPSALNVADDATRVRPVILNYDHRWFQGPSFLFKPSNDWPLMPATVPLAREELKSQTREFVAPTAFVVQPSPVTAVMDNFSNWIWLLRATARAHQAARLFRKVLENAQNSNRDIDFQTNNSASSTLPPLHACFVKVAERHIFQRMQLDSFPEEFTALLSSKPIHRGSRLEKLSPQLGPDQLLRLAGRIGAVLDVDPDTRCPILLDGHHPTTKLLIQHFHVKAGHANNFTVINELRQRFWIIGLRNAVRSTASKCLLCRIKKARPMLPPIGNLPYQRMAHHQRPFTFTGLDYFGPLTVTVGRRHEKRYVALFTCLTIRAVHLELVHSLSADSAIMSLRRFFARRGTPNTIFSDNGTAFVGANRILKEFLANEVRDFAATRSVAWSFIPPAAPNFGGCWERLVRSIKVALSATLKEKAPKEEVLKTLLAEAERVVNSRPLGHVATDPDSPTSLTPFHFLLGTASNDATSEIQLDDGVLDGRADFKKALRLTDHFWKRWVKEILPDLQPRQVSNSCPTLKVGDIAVIADDSLPRGTWPKGRISKVYPGQDGVVRVVDVATPCGILRRPLRKLVKVPI